MEDAVDHNTVVGCRRPRVLVGAREVDEVAADGEMSTPGSTHWITVDWPVMTGDGRSECAHRWVLGPLYWAVGCEM